MPHINTKPNQHDFTVSAWILREFDDGLKVFVHMHKKMQKYTEIGGHIELDETPWQTIAHELEEESGYKLSELEIYQPNYIPVDLGDYFITHPVPVFIHSYQPKVGHYHTDICYAFYASDDPSGKPAEGESQDIAWMTIEELEDGSEKGFVLPDIIGSYKSIVGISKLPYYHLVKTDIFSLGKPVIKGLPPEISREDDLEIKRYGNPVLRAKAKRLDKKEILHSDTQDLIRRMYDKLSTDEYGVGLAAPQVGESFALSVIGIKPTPNRPNIDKFNTVIINPEYEGVGRQSDMWEGCISCGTGDDTLFAQVPRYRKIRASWLDEKAVKHEKALDGFVAHVFQHETDHLNGILFVDKVKDTSSYMMSDEYRKRIKLKNKD